MKKIRITYNPYKLTTDITVDGEKPYDNSSLNVFKRRLQEWVDRLPSILIKEYPDNSYEIHFTGTQVDYEDLTASFRSVKKIKVEFSFEKKGVLSNPDDDDSVIPTITRADFIKYKADGTISGGMLPKIENALSAIDTGVERVIITLATAIDGQHGTVIKQ